MASKKISELSSSLAPPLSGVTAVVHGGTTYKSTLSTLRQVLVDSGSHVFTGSQTINGNLVVSGSLTAQQYILSSSITNILTETISGSSNFGNSLDDTHIFTGSVRVTGSLNTIGDLTISGSLNLLNNININGITNLGSTSETIIPLNNPTTGYTHNFSSGSILYVTGATSNITVDVVNIPTTNNKGVGLTVIIEQGVSAFADGS